MAHLKLLVIGAALTVATAPTPASAEPLKGQDRNGSQCVRKDSTGKTEEASGSCGTVCKDKEITTATGEDQASGYQYTCKSPPPARAEGGRFDWGWIGLLGLAGLLGLRGPRRDHRLGSDGVDRRP